MRIAITSIGIVSAIGHNANDTLHSLLTETSGISLLDNIPAGIVTLDNRTLLDELSLDPPLPRSVLLGIKAAREALASAHCTDFAFVNGNTVGGMDLTEQNYDSWLHGATPATLHMHDVGSCTDLIASHLPGVSFSTSISTACSSALNSIIMAADLIRSGRAQRVLAGGTECLSRFHTLGFNSLGIVDHQPCRPFDASRNGITLGEGAAYLMLESEFSARARGARILGFISGYGNACDAHHQTASSPDGDGAFLAMSKAIRMAQLSPRDIGYINAHGTSTIDNDRSESNAIRRLFADSLPLVSSTKGFTGHTTSASGSIDCVISLIAMLHGFIPANLGFQSPDPDCITPVPHTLHRSCNVMMCNAFGFGGNDSSLIFQSPLSDTRPLPPLPRISLSTTSEVINPDDYSHFISPIEARRLSLPMRLIIAAASQALSNAGITSPDAIVAATSLGTIQYTRRILDTLSSEVKPSLFIYSTHNSISSLLAIRLKCHGANCTFANGTRSLNDAHLYAEMLIAQGDARNVLLLSYDEDDEVWSQLMTRQHLLHTPRLTAKIITPL